MGLLSQASRLINSSKPQKAGLSIYQPNSSGASTDIQFQYWPETINDSKSPNYDRRFAPGASHPIIQFQNGGERELSFTAIFTDEQNPGETTNLLQGNFNVGLGASERHDTTKESIPVILSKIRSYTYPIITQGVTKAPPLCLVVLPNSGIITSLANGPNKDTFKDSFVGVMTQCQITYQAFHRTGNPRIVEVQLAFLETIQIGNGWSYVDSETVRNALKKSDGGFSIF